MSKTLFARGRANFLTGLAIVLPAAASIAVVVWLFGTISNFTNILLFFLPRSLTHAHEGRGEVHWYWSLVALAVAVVLIGLIGRMARHFVGKKLIQFVDLSMLRIPLLNKIYGALKQVNQAFTSSHKSSFKQVVLVQFPRPGLYSVGFITGSDHAEVQARTSEMVVSVFVPTTPNPTTGFLILVPEAQLIKMQMSVAEGIKFIISLGAVAPDYPTRPISLPALEPAPPSPAALSGAPRE